MAHLVRTVQEAVGREVAERQATPLPLTSAADQGVGGIGGGGAGASQGLKEAGEGGGGLGQGLTLG